MHPVLASGNPVDPNLNAGTLASSNQTRQPAANPVMEFWGMLTAQVTCTFNTFFFEQPSIVVTLPMDLLERICIDITEDKDLYLYTLTCTTLFKMRTSPQIQPRIRNFQITCLLFCGGTLTCQLLNEKAAQLIRAVSDRPLTQSESVNLGIPPIRFSSPHQQMMNAEGKLIAERCEKEFYAVFKTRCVEVNINQIDNGFILCATAAIGELTKKTKSLNTTNKETIKCKLKTTTLSFNRKIFNDLINAFAQQPVAMLTPFRFKEQVKELKALFPHQNTASIEALLRQNIRTTGNNQAAMVELSIAALLDADPEAQQLNLFLNELLMPITPGQEMTRSAALHAIID